MRDIQRENLLFTGNQMAAEVGADTCPLIQRMGQSTVRAALIYQPATSARDEQISDGLNARVERDRQGASGDDPDP